MVPWCVDEAGGGLYPTTGYMRFSCQQWGGAEILYESMNYFFSQYGDLIFMVI